MGVWKGQDPSRVERRREAVWGGGEAVDQVSGRPNFLEMWEERRSRNDSSNLWLAGNGGGGLLSSVASTGDQVLSRS